MFKNEKIFTSLLVIFAILGVITYIAYYIHRINIVTDGPYANVMRVNSKNYYLDPAKDFLDGMGIDTSNTKVAYTSSPDNAEDAFLMRTIGEREGFLYRKQFDYPNTLINVRFFKELVNHESIVMLDPNSGYVRGFSEIIPENEERTNITKEEAQQMAEDFLYSQNVNINQLEFKDYQSNQIQKRLDHMFTFKVKGSEVDTKYGQGYITYTVSIYGDKVGLYMPAYFIPEDFNRELDKLNSIGGFLSLISLLVTVLMGILGLLFTVVAYKKGKVNWKLYTSIFALLTLTSIIAIVADHNSILNYYTNDQILWVFVLSYIITSLIYGSTLNVIVPLAGISANYLETQTKTRIGDVRKNLIPSVIRGYLLAGISLGITGLIYYIGETYFDVWSFGVSEPSQSYIEYTFIFSVLYLCISSSLTEEIIFRYFGFVFLNKYIKSTFIAMFVAVLVWALGHSSYETYPIYFRAIELVIGGMLWAYFVLRYNIATTISAHFIFNGSLSAIGMILTGNPIYLAYAIFILSVPMLSSVIYLALPKRTKSLLTS